MTFSLANIHEPRYNQLMNSAELFKATVKAISDNFAMEAAFEIEAATIRRSNPERASVLNAALFFVQGMDFLATQELGTEAPVRRLRVEVNNNPMSFNLPGRN